MTVRRRESPAQSKELANTEPFPTSVKNSSCLVPKELEELLLTHEDVSMSGVQIILHGGVSSSIIVYQAIDLTLTSG